MAQPNILTRAATIAELPDGRWLWKERGRYYKQVRTARDAVLADNRSMIKDSGGNADGVVTTITWEPRTEQGTAAIASL